KLADERFQQVQATYEREKSNQVKRDDLKRHIERLNQYLPVVKAIDTKQNELNELKEKTEEAQSRYDEVTSSLKMKTKELEVNEQKVEQSERALESLSEKEEKIQDMREQHRMLKHYIDLYDQHKTLTQKLNQQKEVYQKAKNLHDTFENKWLNNQASVLATHLHDGEACPVCGSLSHPHKVTDNQMTVTKEAFDESKADLEQKHIAYRTVHADV